jgi:hypothetical protein
VRSTIFSWASRVIRVTVALAVPDLRHSVNRVELGVFVK